MAVSNISGCPDSLLTGFVVNEQMAEFTVSKLWSLAIITKQLGSPNSFGKNCFLAEEKQPS